MNAHHCKPLASPQGIVALEMFCKNMDPDILDTYKEMFMALYVLNAKEFRKNELVNMQRTARIASAKWELYFPACVQKIFKIQLVTWGMSLEWLGPGMFSLKIVLF